MLDGWMCVTCQHRYKEFPQVCNQPDCPRSDLRILIKENGDDPYSDYYGGDVTGLTEKEAFDKLYQEGILSRNLSDEV